MVSQLPLAVRHTKLMVRTTLRTSKRSSGLLTSMSSKHQAKADVSVDFANMTAIHVAGPYLVSLSSSLKFKFRLIKQLAVKCIPLFKKSNDPSIVNITSLGAYFLNRSCCEFSYAQSKAAGTFPVMLGTDGRGTYDQADVCWTYAFQDQGQLDLSRYAPSFFTHPIY